MYISDKIKNEYLNFRQVQIEKKRIADQFRSIGDHDRAEKLQRCGTHIVYGWNERKQKHGYVTGLFCDDRFCPSCQQQLHRERSSRLNILFKAYLEGLGMRAVMWTFSPFENCSIDDLKNNCSALINLYNATVKEFFNRESGVVGIWRTLEFTEHKDKSPVYRYDYSGKKRRKYFVDEIYDGCQFHPHIHNVVLYRSDVSPFADVYAITQFQKEYIVKAKKSKNQRLKPFQSVVKYQCVVHYDPIAPGDDAAAFEVAKYISVSKNLSSDNLEKFVAAVTSMQCSHSSGLLKWGRGWAETWSIIQNGNFEGFSKYDKDNVYFRFVNDGLSTYLEPYDPYILVPPSMSVYDVLAGAPCRGSPVIRCSQYAKNKNKYTQISF